MPLYQVAIQSLEDALPVYHVSAELALVDLSVGEQQNTDPLLAVLAQLALVADPLLVEVVEVGVVEAFPQDCRGVVVHHSFPVELIVLPFPLIGHLSIGVVQCPVPFHFVVLPFPPILATLLVDKLALSVPHPVLLVPLISRPNLVLLNHVSVG